MKVVILCGGLGTRLSEETYLKPKPMVTIGGKPILWHIMNIYSAQGFNEFVLALGYKSEYIKEYFLNFYALNSDISVNLSSGQVSYLRSSEKNWKIDLIDTGDASMTGGRLKRLQSYIEPHGTFMMTYGDGVANVNLNELLNFHKNHGKYVSVTSVRPPARFGNIVFQGNQIVDFHEKPQTGDGWVNGGYFVMEPSIFNYLENDLTVLEGKPLEKLASDGELMGYQHDGFWQCMDTIRDKNLLEELWASNTAKWKVWNEKC
ncbi:glucose-1-phosphate cytidylyltransferase [Fluviispira sanaruensis]|uniref:Glucose-1-phosphate cytidylyltransferase n=1 Tax=Fluviispira sanaruensis TaxID=2493639 RepID=A0A4P2VM88_FLUSA|nr:glucose-1-phosphate cytidylyltransferase [Fluviispira sanaruensis]BBH54061.1 glucose-1-phosphate cytidylyltransferase [Fluviispira sanaruensis]